MEVATEKKPAKVEITREYADSIPADKAGRKMYPVVMIIETKTSFSLRRRGR